jgi:hypothetical protein
VPVIVGNSGQLTPATSFAATRHDVPHSQGNLFRLHHSSQEVWRTVKAFVDGRRPGDVQLLSVPVFVPADVSTLGFHETVRKVNALLGQVQDMMKDSQVQLTHGTVSLKVEFALQWWADGG